MENLKASHPIISITQELLLRSGFSGEVALIPGGQGGLPTLTIVSEQDLSMLIGKNGQNLNALEHLVRLIANRRQLVLDAIPFILDINNYRRSRSRQLVELAKTAAQRVISTQRAEALIPMTAFERRLVHTELATHREVETESIGNEPRRRIVIKPLAP